MAASTISQTALAFAPGVLNTQTPACVHASMGMLFVPAPARAMLSTEGASGRSCMEAERTRIASGCPALSLTW